MAANGISTLLPKSARPAAKVNLAQSERVLVGKNSYRPLNIIDVSEINPPRTVPPILGRPWTK